MKIWRYQLDTDKQEIELPLSAKILHVAPGRLRSPFDPYHIDLWAQVPEQAPMVSTIIRIFGTGNPMGNPDLLEYIGTAVMPDGLVWHVYVEHDQMEKRDN